MFAGNFLRIQKIFTLKILLENNKIRSACKERSGPALGKSTKNLHEWFMNGKKEWLKTQNKQEFIDKAINAFSFHLLSFFNFCFLKICKNLFLITVISASYNK